MVTKFTHWPETQSDPEAIQRFKDLIKEIMACRRCFDPDGVKLEMQIGMGVLDEQTGKQKQEMLTIFPCDLHAARLVEVIGGEVMLRRYEKVIREHRA